MSDSSNNTVLAWLQKELSIYAELLLISPIRDLSFDYWHGKPTLCLAHHFFPASIPNFLQQLNHPPDCYQLFQDQLGVTQQEEWADYLQQIQRAVDRKREEDALCDLHIGSVGISAETEFEKYASSVLLPLNKLFHQLVDLSIKEELSTTTRSPSPRIHEEVMIAAVEPLKSRRTDDTTSLSSSTTSLTLEEIESSLTAIEQNDLVDFHHWVDKLPYHPDLAVRISTIDATHAALHLQLHKGDLLRTTIQFTNTAAYIRNELEFIQAKMLKTTTTDVGIQDLESRAKLAGISIDHMSQRFQQLMSSDKVTEKEFQFLQDKYRLICSWVDDVRVWFVEAERIRSWIEQRIQVLEEIPALNSLEEVELDYEMDQIHTLNSRQEQLEKQVQVFDKEDMTRLRAHVKALTGSERRKKDLSPADTTTIEITFTTLMTLDRLMHLLRRHAYELQMLTLRMYWEQEYHISVTWVRTKGEQLRGFVQHTARWRPPPLVLASHDVVYTTADIIAALIEFEKQSAAFDQGQFTVTVNMYQDLDDACNIELPSHLESRQVALEEAFEELTHRIAFARQVVEQYLVVTDFLGRADKLKQEGLELKQDMTTAAEQHHHTQNTNEFTKKVSLFQENALRLVTGVASRVPYPEATHPTDQQGNEDANQVIRMVIGARKSALVLFGEALDQSLSNYRRALQLQKRGKQLQDEIARLSGWVDERMRSIKKSKVDVFVGKCALDEVDLARLKKERDGQVSKLKGIKENELSRLQENIEALKISSSQPPINPNTVALVTALHVSMATLSDQLAVLQEALQVHSLCLDILGKRIAWETQHSKTSLWISNMTFQIWEFVSRKAQWRPDMEALETTGLDQEFAVMQHKVQEFRIEQLDPVDQTFNDLVDGFSNILLNSSFGFDQDQPQDNITNEHVQRRQDTLIQSFNNLNDLIDFSSQVILQHHALTAFSSQVTLLTETGCSLMSDIQQATEAVMKMADVNTQRQVFVEAVKEMSQQVVQLWMQHGTQLPYPQCPEDARATRPSTTDDEISTEVATVVFKTYTELQELVKRLSELLQRLDISIVYRLQLEKWSADAEGLTHEIKTLASMVQSACVFDMNTASVVDHDSAQVTSDVYLEKAAYFTAQLNKIKLDQYDDLETHLKQLQQELSTEECDSVDPSLAEPYLKQLETSWQALTAAVQLFSSQANCCVFRSTWKSLWTEQANTLSRIQDNVREWTHEKSVWSGSTIQRDSQVLDSLVDRMQSYSALMEEHQVKLVPLKSAYADMTVAYKSLQNRSEFVDYTSSVETEQEDLEKLSAKLQDSITTQLAEIQLIKSRHDWETAVNNQLKLCAEFGQQTESFIRNDARWSPCAADAVDVQPIQDASTAQLTLLSALLNDLNQLQQKHTLLQTEDVFKKKADLESSIERVKSHVDFLDQVLEQRTSTVSSLSQVAELEALAESIKTKFLSDTVQDGQEALQDYSTRVAQLSSNVALVMVYPVRHYRDHDTACREQDIAHNTMMAEMISARKSRLDELGHSLEAILKSKERLSRCKAAEESYISEARVVKEWIETKAKQVKEVQAADEVQELRHAVHAMGAIQAATMSYTSSMQGLKDSAAHCLTMIQQQGQDDDGILARIQSTQSSMAASWDDLLSSVESRKGQLSTALRHAEYNQCVSSFHQECDAVRQKVSGVDLALVTEQVTTEWQNDVRALESDYIEHIKSRLTEEKIKSSQDGVINDMTDMLSKVLSDFEVLKQMIGNRTTKANNHRFKSEYFNGAEALETCMQETRLKLDALKSSACILYGQDTAVDQLTVQAVTESYQSIVDQFENQHHEKYDEQRSFYRFLQLNKVADLDAVDTRQQALEKSWKQLKSNVANDKQYVDVVSQWFDLHGKLNEMQFEALSSVFARLDQMVMDTTMPTFLEQDAALLKLLESRLSACYDIAAGLNDDGNLKCYQLHHDILQKDLAKATTLLAEKREMAQKHVDFTSCQQAIQDVQQSVDQVVKAVHQRLQSIVIEDGSSKHLEQLYRNSSSGVANTESVEKKLSTHLNSIETGLLSSLASKHANDDRLTAMNLELTCCSELLETSLKTEQSVNDMLRRVLGQARSAESMTTWIENCNTAISQVLGDQMDEGEAALEVASLSQKLIDFENVIGSFKDLSSNLMAMSVEEHPLLKQLKEIVENNTSMINGKWQETQDQLKSVEAVVEKTTKGVAIARKIKHITAIVGEAREYVTSVKLFDSDDVSIHTQDFSEEEDEDKTAVGDDDFEAEQQPLLSMLRESEVKEIQRNLEVLEIDVKPQIELEMKELSSMMTEVDNTFVRQHQEVQESMDSLYDLLRTKNVELEKAKDIGKYLTIADDIEILQSSLEEVVSKSTPHHTALLGNGFNRIDLQAKLIELDARFKYYEKKIVQNLATAKEQATLLIDKKYSESSLVEVHLKSMQDKWDLIKKQFKTRKIELSRTIDTSMDSKEQHARIRKSSLPTRKASSLLRDRADLSISTISPSSSSTASSSTSSSTKSNNRINPGRSTSRYLTPPLQHQPSKSASHLKSKTHRSTIKPPLNSYVADPDNDLDIEIGRIVNETPYRVKVKMVPGEVGRYWFGNLNPKLAYCRVLKSKMVMVRVGGGWTELSQFLRDHALLEGDFIPRSQRRNKMIPEEEEPKSPTIQEGFIETRRDLTNRPPNQPQQQRSSTTTNSSGSRSNTTSSYPTGSPSHSANTSGYKEGDKFITLDQHGNQLEVKMRKANDFTKRRIARRKEKPVHNT